MPDLLETPWSNHPNAPKLAPWLYFLEKANFSGLIIGAILYGIIIVLFFQCMGAFLNPINRTRGRTKLGLTAYTVIMFSLTTINIAMNLGIQSICYVDFRGFPGVPDWLGPGPAGYMRFTSTKAIQVVPDIFFFLNFWLADGLLLYRCSVIYAMNYWFMGFPYLMYIGSVAMGIAFIHQISTSTSDTFLTPLFSIAFSLNVLLTLMIVMRLTLHGRKIRNAFGAPTEANRLYKAVTAMLIESLALYSVIALLYFALRTANNPAQFIFYYAMLEAQVIATFLIILRVANRSAVTSHAITGSNSSVHFRREGSLTGHNESLVDAYPMNPMGRSQKTTGELRVGVETTIYTRRSKESLTS